MLEQSKHRTEAPVNGGRNYNGPKVCLLYTSDAADERSSVDLGGRRIIKKKKERESIARAGLTQSKTKNDT